MKNTRLKGFAFLFFLVAPSASLAMEEQIQQTWNRSPAGLESSLSAAVAFVDSLLAPAVSPPALETELFVEYLTDSGETKSLRKTQTLSMAGSARDLERKWGVTFERANSADFPLQMVLGNVWENLANREVALISLPFEFQGSSLESGRVYICPQVLNEQAGCRVQLLSAQVDLQIPIEGAICKLKIESATSLDFATSEHLLTVSAYPSTQFPGAEKGAAFAAAFECSYRGKMLLRGHFLHGTQTAPTL